MSNDISGVGGSSLTPQEQFTVERDLSALHTLSKGPQDQITHEAESGLINQLQNIFQHGDADSAGNDGSGSHEEQMIAGLAHQMMGALAAGQDSDGGGDAYGDSDGDSFGGDYGGGGSGSEAYGGGGDGYYGENLGANFAELYGDAESGGRAQAKTAPPIPAPPITAVP